MSGDLGSIGNAVYDLIFYAGMVVFAFAAYRGFEMAKAFVSRIYRTRARWIAAMSLALLLNDIAGHAPYIGNIGIGVASLGFISVFFVVLALMPFIDSTVLVALDMDFFHRNTLHWRQARALVYILLYGVIAFFLVLIYFLSLPAVPGWATYLSNSIPFEVLSLGIVGATLAYSALTLLVCSRRAHDMVLRRHLMLLGLAFAFGTIAVLNDFSVGNLVIDGALGVVIPVLWYFASVSLSPIGRVSQVPAPSSAPPSPDRG